jgi:hypothetical protein
MAYTEFRVKQKTRWDQVAYQAYGDIDRMNEIIEANPELQATASLEVGTVLRIPILDEPTIEADFLPPWKQ